MISERSNRGRHKLVLEPTACRNPLSNSLAEVESSRCKTFTNLAVCLTGPRRHWVVVGSFIPRSILWDSDISSIRVKRFLLKSNFRFSQVPSTGEPLVTDDRLLHQKISKILSDFLSRPCARCFCNSLPPKYPQG